MKPLQAIINAARRLDAMFPGYFPEAKHNHGKDFGWPERITFEMLYRMYCRNGLATAGVDKTILKTWQDNPQLWETEKPKETTLESDIRQRFDDLRLWQNMAEADRRGMVGGYSGAILRLADSKRFQEPVDRVPGGLLGLVEVIPAWAGQLIVAEWDTDETSPQYGQPRMYQFSEAQVGNDLNKARSFTLHPDRVVIWSQDGTVHGRSALEAGYNDLLDAEKVKGAGGEGFWKNAKSAPVLEANQDVDLARMAQAMGVSPDGMADAMNDTVDDFNRGFDKFLMLQGMQAKTLGITLPSPEHFFNIAVQGFAASINIPIKILVGNQTGERASTEDARDWAQSNNARRVNQCRPTIMGFVQRLERFGILPKRDWHLDWSDLTEADQSEKINRADKMATINQKMGLEPPFLPEEIRGVLGLDPLAPSEDDTPPSADDEGEDA